MIQRRTRGRRLAAASLLALGLAGCQTSDPGQVASRMASQAPSQVPAGSAEALEPAVPAAVTAYTEQPADVKYFPSDEPLRLGIEDFQQGNYGLAQRYFRDAVEKAPRDATAWIGLAASYDRLGRFDLADRAYHSVIRLTGETVQILNNEGYSYMLRGDLSKARAKFSSAYRREPDNPTIANNLHLLDTSSKYIQRPPE